MYTKSQLEERNTFEMMVITQVFHNLKIEVSTLGSGGDPMRVEARLKDTKQDRFFAKVYDYYLIEENLKGETTYAFELFIGWLDAQSSIQTEGILKTLYQEIERLDPEYYELLRYSNQNILGGRSFKTQVIDMMRKYLDWKWETRNVNKQETDEKPSKPLLPVACKTPSEAVERAVRPSKWGYYMGIAKAVATRSTCLRRQYGAVVVKNDVIIATGYNGAARGEKNCCDAGECWRESHGIPHGEQYEKCVAVHAEANAIISASRSELMGATMYLYGSENGKNCEVEPCLMCNRLLRNSGINLVFCASVDDLSNPVENPKKKWYC